MKGQPITILLVEDDPAHAEIVRRNMENARVANKLMWVKDGQEALEYLRCNGRYAHLAGTPYPHLVLLDLRLPRIDGLEVLKTIKSDDVLKGIPVVIMTTSAAETDIVRAYQNCANSYIVKPLDLAQFASLLDALGFYWLICNEVPY